MRVFVCSDTHGNFVETLQAISLAGVPDLIIHLGDDVDDATMIEQFTDIPMIKVAGNCDRGLNEMRECCEVIGGYRVFMTHGDMYNVKCGLRDLLAKATAEQAQVVLFGHTHDALIQEIDGMLLVNPGTMHMRSAGKSVALLTLDPEGSHATIIPFPPAP